MRFAEGNGHGKGIVQRTPIRNGHVVYHAGNPPPPEELMGLALEQNLRKDLIENPSVRVRAVLPIVQEGNTLMIHLWYDDMNMG
jgi:hypothetical protein